MSAETTTECIPPRESSNGTAPLCVVSVYFILADILLFCRCIVPMEAYFYLYDVVADVDFVVVLFTMEAKWEMENVLSLFEQNTQQTRLRAIGELCRSSSRKYILVGCAFRERKKNEERINSCQRRMLFAKMQHTQSKVRRFPPIGFQDHSQDSVH